MACPAESPCAGPLLKVTMAKQQPDQTVRLKEAARLCRLAIQDCEALLDRTAAMLRRSQQDNLPPAH